MQFNLTQIGKIMQAVGDFDDQEDLSVHRVQTDSRLVEPGDLFVCIPGERFDGHSFAREAVHKGAIALVVQKPLWDLSEVPVLLVQDSIKALSRLAAHYRREFTGKVIAVTGTAGKTTTKEMLASILKQKSKVDKNYKNWNNLLGVSLTILSFELCSDFWVLEAGINHLGEMQELAEVIQPDIVLLNNVGKAHLQGLGNVKQIAREKLRLLEQGMPGTLAVISADYPELKHEAALSLDCRKVEFSCYNKEADYTGEYLGLVQGTQGEYRLLLQKEEITVLLPISGQYMLENVLAAAGAAHQLGEENKNIKLGLAELNLPEHRSDLRWVHNYLILDDCYNANPFSMSRALKYSLELSQGRPLVLFLGDMKELGEAADIEHERLGKEVGSYNPEMVFYTGTYFKQFEKGFLQELKGSRLKQVSDEKEFIGHWRVLGLKEALIMFKASRGCFLERFVQVLEQELRR